MACNSDSVFCPHSLASGLEMLEYSGRFPTHSHFLQDSVTDIGFNLLDLFEGCRLVETPDEKIYVARRCKLLVIVLSVG